MKRILLFTVISLLGLGLLLISGCSKKVTRQADVSAGDYYSEVEFKGLSTDMRDQYCEDLANELTRLEQATDAANMAGDAAGDPADLKRQLADVQSRYESQQYEVKQVQEEVSYFESLPTSYSVLRGDCLWNISGQEQIYADPVKWPRIYRANRDQIKNPNLIYPDQVFSIPRDWPTTHRVVKGEFLSKIAGYWEVYDSWREWPKLYEANREQISDPDLIYPDQMLDIPR